MGRRFHPRSFAAIGWARPSDLTGSRHETLSARLGVEIERAALKLTRDITKRRARALLADPGQLDMIAPGLSAMTPGDMAAKVAELKRARRSLKCRTDALVGRVDAHNLNAAALVARLLRRAEWREMLAREAA
jgi:hypothetical protein